MPRLVQSSVRYSAQPYQLVPSPRGSLSNLVAQPLKSLQPGPGQVLLKVSAVGVNFRDVLNVLGLYPGDPGAPGGDVAGVIAAIGPKVNFRCDLVCLFQDHSHSVWLVPSRASYRAKMSMMDILFFNMISSSASESLPQAHASS